MHVNIAESHFHFFFLSKQRGVGFDQALKDLRLDGPAYSNFPFN